MKLEQKLYNLYLKIVENVEKREQIDNRNGWTVEYKEGINNKYFINIRPRINSMEDTTEVYEITFQDLNTKLNKEEYENIVTKIKEKINIFTEIEKNRKLKQQEIIVDRLLSTLKMKNENRRN